jgi:hypothetical protein
MFAPATRARDRAVPAIEVPDADIVFVPAAPPPPDADIVIAPADEDRLMFDPATRRIWPDAVVVVPAVVPPAAVDELIPNPCTVLPVAEIVIVLAPVERARPAPADKIIVPVLDAKPLAEKAFSPLTDIVMLPAAVAVWRLMFAPAASANESAVPAMLVPEAEIVFVPYAGDGAPTIVIASLLPWLSVIFVPATRESVLLIGAEVTVPAVAPPATEVAET